MKYYYIADKKTNQEWVNLTDLDGAKTVLWRIITSRDQEVRYGSSLISSKALPLKEILDFDTQNLTRVSNLFDYEFKIQDVPFGDSLRSQISYCLERIDRDGLEDCTNQILAIFVANKLTQ